MLLNNRIHKAIGECIVTPRLILTMIGGENFSVADDRLSLHNSQLKKKLFSRIFRAANDTA